jgi:N6-adenosine-specific RNA methylase IME4
MNEQNNIGLVTPIAGAVSLVSSSQNAGVMSLADLSSLEIHEAAYLFPEMQEQEFAELKEDIRVNGLQIPILTFGEKLVDGRHRLRACMELGIIPRFEQMVAANDASIVQAVVGINLHRRHLSEGKRALIGASLTNSAIGSNQHTAGAVSQTKVAADLGISVDSIARGKKVLKHGIPELVEAVSSGRLNITSAAKLAELAKEDQSQLNFDDIKAIQAASKEINKAKFEVRRQERLQAIEAKRANNKPLTSGLGNFGVIYADPPWDYLGTAVPYPVMTLQEICDMPIDSICAEDAVLFMWCSNSLLPDALKVVEAWGFTFKTSMVWTKGVAGQGAYCRQMHETLLIGTKGAVPEVPFSARPVSVLNYPRLEHSRKPPEVCDVIDAMYPELSKVELFCRGTPAHGWAGWGNECDYTPPDATTTEAASAPLPARKRA